MNYKNRFKIGDDIRQFAHDQEIRRGIVTKGPRIKTLITTM